MDFSKTKPSKNFEDRTGESSVEKYLRSVLLKFDPVNAYRETRGDLIDMGILKIDGTESMIAKAKERVDTIKGLRDQYISAGLTAEEADILISSGL